MKHNRVNGLLVLCATSFFVGKTSEAQVVRDSQGVFVANVISAEPNRGQVTVYFSVGGRTFTLFVKSLDIYGSDAQFPTSDCQGPPFLFGLGFPDRDSILPDVTVVGNRVWVQTGVPTQIPVLSELFRGVCRNFSDTCNCFATEDVGLDLGQFTPPYQFVPQ